MLEFPKSASDRLWGRTSSLPLPLIVMGVMDDCLGARGPARAVLTLQASANGVPVLSPFIMDNANFDLIMSGAWVNMGRKSDQDTDK